MNRRIMKKRMEHFEFHWAGMPKNIANMIFSKMGYVNISWRDNYGKKYTRENEQEMNGMKIQIGIFAKHMKNIKNVEKYLKHGKSMTKTET